MWNTSEEIFVLEASAKLYINIEDAFIYLVTAEVARQ